jgi:predicted NodU family carbamoyl transferase
MLVLGISGNFSDEDTDLIPNMNEGYFHDAAACLIRDGELLAAAEEERFNRIKQTTKFPINAIRACLAATGTSPSKITAVGHYFEESPIDRSLNAGYLMNPDLPIRHSRELIMGHLNDGLGFSLSDDRLFYTQHHVSHAMSCFVRSGMKEALVVVMDARGENHSTTIFRGYNSRLESLATYGLDKSLGAFYKESISVLAYGLGDEYKVMGLAPYGNPDTYREFFGTTYRLRERGDFYLRPDPVTLISNGFLPRRKGQEFTQQHIDFAAGLQRTLETVAMHVLCYWAERSGLTNLCFVGGVAHNSSLNGVILKSGKFREVFIHPASHDAGSAEGAALNAVYRLGALPFRQPRLRTASAGPSLGTVTEIEKDLTSWGDLIEYEQPADIVETAARLLADGAVLGWAHGRSEFGPRALGSRSILADARPSSNKQRINEMVKKREAYRPFAPVVTVESAEDYFDLPGTRANYDFMSFVVNVHEDRRAELGAVTHIDGTARVQIIDSASNERFHKLVRRFGELTGTPVLLNTSFNNNAEPIVQSTHDAVTCFVTTELDFLVIEDFLVRRLPGPSLPLGGLVPSFRPVTRLVRRTRMTSSGFREVIHEIYLDHQKGAHAEVSSAVYTLLDCADGKRTLESLADAGGGLSDDIKLEIYSLWQQRFFTLRPAGALCMPPQSRTSYQRHSCCPYR